MLNVLPYTLTKRLEKHVFFLLEMINRFLKITSISNQILERSFFRIYLYTSFSLYTEKYKYNKMHMIM